MIKKIYHLNWHRLLQIGIDKKHHILNANTNHIYRKVYNTSRTLLGNEIVNHSDVVGASPVGAAPTTSSFST